MKKQSVVNLKGEKVSDITLKETIWGVEPNDTVLYDALRLTTNSRRQGTADTKTRDEVSGGGRKPWRQKGTGRARQGSTRSPQWPGGGVVFGPHPRSYDIKMNKKERRLALKSALSYKVINNELVILDDLKLKSAKTKDLVKTLETLKLGKNILIVVKELTDEIILATRNLKNIALISADEINTYDIVAADSMIITKDAVAVIEEVLL